MKYSDDVIDDVDELEASDATAGDDPMCAYCGCWEGDACLLPGGGRCGWFRLLPGFAVCTAPRCIQSYIADAGSP